MKKILCALALVSLGACTSDSAPPAECKEFFDTYDKARKEGKANILGLETSTLVNVARQLGPDADKKLTLWDGFDKMYGAAYEEAKAKGDKTVEVMKQEMKRICMGGTKSLQVR